MIVAWLVSRGVFRELLLAFLQPRGHLFGGLDGGRCRLKHGKYGTCDVLRRHRDEMRSTKRIFVMRVLKTWRKDGENFYFTLRSYYFLEKCTVTALTHQNAGHAGRGAAVGDGWLVARQPAALLHQGGEQLQRTLKPFYLLWVKRVLAPDRDGLLGA